MKRLIFGVFLFALSSTNAADLGIVGLIGDSHEISRQVLDGGDSLMFTLKFSAKLSTSVGFHAWFDDFGDTSNDTIMGYWRPLASPQWHTLGVGSPFIPIAWLTDNSPWTASTVLNFSDSCVYWSMVPDSIVGGGVERPSPPACEAIQFKFFTTASDCVLVNFKAVSK